MNKIILNLRWYPSFGEWCVGINVRDQSDATKGRYKTPTFGPTPVDATNKFFEQNPEIPRTRCEIREIK